MSAGDWSSAQRGLGVVAVVFLLVALERLANAAMAGSLAGAGTAWMLSAVFGSSAAVLLGLLIVVRGVDRRSHRFRSRP